MSSINEYPARKNADSPDRSSLVTCPVADPDLVLNWLDSLRDALRSNPIVVRRETERRKPPDAVPMVTAGYSSASGLLSEELEAGLW